MCNIYLNLTPKLNKNFDFLCVYIHEYIKISKKSQIHKYRESEREIIINMQNLKYAPFIFKVASLLKIIFLRVSVHFSTSSQEKEIKKKAGGEMKN